MTVYFEPHHDSDDDHDRADYGSADGLAELPAAFLQRHGAMFLNPTAAAQIPDEQVTRTTVYRANTLLIPGSILDNQAHLQALNAVLAQIGLSLVVPRRVAQEEGRTPAAAVSGELATRLAQLPRAAVLVPAKNGKTTQPPVVVNAWVALQALRAAARANRLPGLNQQSVRRIALNHLLFGSAITGSPASDGGGISGNPASDGGGITGPGSTDSYLFGGRDARIPVDLCIEWPARAALADIKTRYGRRPVIMMLDTGVREQPCLDVQAGPGLPGGYGTVPDGFVAVDQATQGVIDWHSQQAAGAGVGPQQLIDGPWDRPFTDDPLIGELTTHIGHGVFIAGIARQIAPDAQVLSWRIMTSDGVVGEDVLICALKLLATRVAAATSAGGDMTQMVDVLSLSLGYFSETPADEDYTSGLWEVLDILLGMGIAVTAAAGNYATSRRFYPAALADRAPSQHPSAPLISVGALNPNGSKALFSDGGRWIRAWAPGAAMISTFPVDLNGSREPPVRRPAHPGNTQPPGLDLPAGREAFDADDYKRNGYAVWSGTSFSAPLVAAQLARELLAGAAGANGLKLDQGGPDAAVDRTMQALKNLDWPG